MTRATRAIVNLGALQHNLQVARQAAPKAKHMAIIKANGYGHGLLPVARALQEEADAFGVATLDEAVSLREGGVAQNIVLLEGFTSAEELLLIRAYNLQAVIHHSSQIDLLEHDNGTPISVWLKLDTGMHRLGFEPEQCVSVLQRLTTCKNVVKPVRLMTHLCCADDRDSTATQQQLASFDNAASSCNDMQQSIANSAGILGWPQSHRDWVRPGIMLYGVSPFIDHQETAYSLQPAMTLTSHLISVKTVQQGESVGYGASWTADRETRIGIVAIGYGDGYPRHARSGTPVLVNQNKVSLVGRVSMDMLSVDLTECANAKIGDPVVLWGEGLPVEIVAAHADTIAYTLLCGVTQRVKYEYLE